MMGDMLSLEHDMRSETPGEKMVNYQKLLLLLLAGVVIVSVGCISPDSHDNLITNSQNTLTISQILTTNGTTPMVCQPAENATPWIHIEPVDDHNVGENFSLKGTTNLNSGEGLSIFVYQSPPSPNKKLPSEYTDVSGVATVRTGECDINIWTFSENLTTLRPSLYTTQVRAANNATIEANLVQFSIIDDRISASGDARNN
jgi:hypothetical protein